MSSFLNIVTLFDSPEARSVKELSSRYSNHTGLRTLIVKLIDTYLPESRIKNKVVLLKPNWVKHSSRPDDEICLRTNDDFLLVALDVILNYKPGLVILGDAPIQGCKWDEVVTIELTNKIKSLSIKYNIPIRIEDFRRRIYDVSINDPESDLKSLSDYLIFDLGKQSYLEEITIPGKNNFRVTNYNPDRMSSAHSQGVHKYCISKAFFDADVVISLPKIKTHQKAGITGAVKNIVGINGDKDFLPHHRLGGANMGGDCYPGSSKLRYLSEVLLDKANRNQGKRIFWIWQKFSSLFWKLSFPKPEHSLAAGWHGNDTTWRMVMDLNKIATYGNSDGSLSEKPVRQLFSLCDGIIGGQGDGPLEPKPLPLGVISFTNNSFVNDRAMALLMGFPIEKIPLLNNIAEYDEKCEISLNGDSVTLNTLKDYSVKTLPPKGWINYLT